MRSVAEIKSRHVLLIKRARHMRANPTDAERKLWYLLRDRRLGERWRRQEIIDDRYIVEFICFEHRLIIEADGSQHAESSADVERDLWLERQGFRVLRFWNSEILTNIDGIATAITTAVKSLAARTRGGPHTLPSPATGEGLLRSAESYV